MLRVHARKYFNPEGNPERPSVSAKQGIALGVSEARVLLQHPSELCEAGSAMEDLTTDLSGDDGASAMAQGSYLKALDLENANIKLVPNLLADRRE